MAAAISTRHCGERGYTLIEITIVLLITGLLAALAASNFTRFATRSKRVEGRVGLSAVWDAQQVYMHDHLHYAGTFDELGFSFTNGKRLSPVSVTGGQYTYNLSQPSGQYSWYCTATANLDADPWPDVLVLDQGNSG